MPNTPEGLQAWKDRHAAVSAHLLEVHERWGSRVPLDPEARAAMHRDYQVLLKEFEQFKEMPEEVWDNILDEPETSA